MTGFPLFMPKSELLRLLFAHCLFLKDHLEQFAPVAIYKSNSEWFAQVAHDKRATGAICSFSQANLFRSQKTIVSLKNRWANSQPWGILYSKFYFRYKIAKSLKKVKFYVSEIKYIDWELALCIDLSTFFLFYSKCCTVLVQVLSSGVSQGEDPHLVTVAVQVLSCGVSPYLVPGYCCSAGTELWDQSRWRSRPIHRLLLT